jgi:alpha-ribazole phosphatase
VAVILVRHPETIDPRVIAGQLDVAIATHALDAIDALAASLPPVRYIVSSDLSRCRILADAVAAQRGIACTYDPRWREQSFGAWDGKRWDEVDGREYLDHWTTATPPGGESIAEVQTRVAAALADVALDGGDDTLVVTHAGPIRCALAIAGGLSLEDAFAVPIPFGSWRSV